MTCFIRLRGLPWSVTHEEILNFLKNVNVVNGTKGIHMIQSRWDGKNTGEAFVELATDYDEKEAFKLNKHTIGHRYIEIFSATKEETLQTVNNAGTICSQVVKLRGLPYAITESMIENFFKGLNLKRNRDGIFIIMDKKGRATGEAYVQFQSLEDTEQALLRNREKIAHRYIEIFRSSLSEMRRQFGNRPGPYDIKDRGGLRKRDEIGRGNIKNSRDSGFCSNNRDEYSRNLKPFLVNNSGNELNLNDVGMVNNLTFNSNKSCYVDHLNNNASPANTSSGFNSQEKNDFFWNTAKTDSERNGYNFNSNFAMGSGTDCKHFNNAYGVDNMKVNMTLDAAKNLNSISKMCNLRNNMEIQNDDDDLFCIHMRGLPYNCFENEIFKFFEPIKPANIKIIFNSKGLHSGNADAYFCSYEDSQNAMKKHMEQIGSRYIELFFDGKIKHYKIGLNRQNSQHSKKKN